jgi:hypothetical protein
MCHGNNLFPLRMFERVMIAVDAIKDPTVLFQLADQLAAIPFHGRISKASANKVSLKLISASASQHCRRVLRSCVYK